MSKQTIKINGLDNVAVALTDLRTGEEHEGVVLAEDIVKGHKFALTEIAEGEQIIKYGNPIARAVHTIPAGAHVHTHNARTNLSENLEYVYNKVETDLPEAKPRTVNVYRRADGNVGIRNELWIIPTVGCVNAQAKLIAAQRASTEFSPIRTPTAVPSSATTTSARSSFCRKWFVTPTRAACSCSA